MLVTVVGLVILAGVLAAAEAPPVCVLKLKVRPPLSNWASGGSLTAPVPAEVVPSKMNVTGHVFLAMPTDSTACPPDLTASNAVEMLQNSSVVQPITNDDGILTFQPNDIYSNVTLGEDNTIAKFDLHDMKMAYTGELAECQYARK